MKITMVLEREIEAVSLRRAWLISRACNPGCDSPISPSISALGVSAATESTTSTSIAPERTSVSVISSACSPVSGWEIRRSSSAGVDRIERVFGVDEGANAALLLRFGDHMQRQRRLARGFGPVNLDHPAARQTPDPKRDVEAERPCRHRLDLDRLLVLAQTHDRALAERPFDLRQGGVERLGLVHADPFHEAKIRLGHNHRPSLTGGVRSAIAVLRGPHQ
jgi:hypothetical protein